MSELISIPLELGYIIRDSSSIVKEGRPMSVLDVVRLRYKKYEAAFPQNRTPHNLLPAVFVCSSYCHSFFSPKMQAMDGQEVRL